MVTATSMLLFVTSSSSSAVAFLAGRPTLLQIDVCESVALQGLNNESLFGRKANNNLMFVNTEHQSPSQRRLDSFGVMGFRLTGHFKDGSVNRLQIFLMIIGANQPSNKPFLQGEQERQCAPIKSKLQHSPSGKARAFDFFSVPGEWGAGEN